MYYVLVYVFIYVCSLFFFFFFNDTATTEIYTLSLHDALPISQDLRREPQRALVLVECGRAIASPHLRAHGDPRHAAAAVRVVVRGLVEHDDQQPVLLERGARNQRRDVGLEPRVRLIQRAVVRVVAQVR